MRHNSVLGKGYTHLGRALYVLLIGIVAAGERPGIVAAQDETSRYFVLEVYFRSGDATSEQYLRLAREFESSRKGVRIAARELANNPENNERLKKIISYFSLPPNTEPLIYGSNQVIHSLDDDEVINAQLQRLVRFDVFTRKGCTRCALAEKTLPQLLARYPALELHFHDITADAVALANLNELVRRHGTAATSTPVMYFCNQLLVGFDQAATSGSRIDKTLMRWTVEASRQEQVPEVTGHGPF